MLLDASIGKLERLLFYHCAITRSLAAHSMGAAQKERQTGGTPSVEGMPWQGAFAETAGLAISGA
jgi:hypothetical protein